MTNYSRIVLFLLMVCFCSPFAAASSTTFSWSVPSSDTTYQYLTFLFGNVSSDLVCLAGNCSTLVPAFFNVLNQGVLAIGSVVLTYVLVMSTASSAHEGEFLGSKNSSLWLPARVTAGVSFLVPTSTGYSLLQGAIMKIVLMGVGMANNIYGVLQNYVETNNTTFAREQLVSSTGGSDQSWLLGQLTTGAKTIFASHVCYQTMVAFEASSTNTSFATLFSSSSGSNNPFSNDPSTNPTFTQGPLFYENLNSDGSIANYGEFFFTDAISALGGASLWQSYVNSSNSENLCGFYFVSYDSTDPKQSAAVTAIQNLSKNLQNIAVNFVAKAYPASVSGGTAPSYSDEQSAVTQAIIQALVDLSSSILDPSVGDASTDQEPDWLSFPLNFYDWIDRGGSSSSAKLGSMNPPTNSNSKVLGNQDQNLASNNTQYQSIYNAMTSMLPTQSMVTSAYDSVSAAASSLLSLQAPDSSIGPVSYMYSVMQEMISPSGDPLITLAQFGQNILKSVFDTLVSAIIAGFVMVSVSAICSSQLSTFALGLYSAMGGFFMSFLLAFGFLLPLGVTLGIYLPLMPVMMYTTSALMWFMMVVESMVAGPIIALGLVAPSQDNLGKAQPAVLMLFNIFLRPSLMVIGLVFGAKLFDLFAVYFSNVVINSFNYVAQAAGFNGWFGLIFIVFWFFYAFSMVAIAQRCYSMTYVLADKVISWIGGQGGNSRDVNEDLQAMQQAIDKGGETLKKEASSFATGLSSLSKGVNDSQIAARKE